MESGYIALGILAIFYYIYIAFYTKKWNSTFSRFWLIFGSLNILLGIIVKWTPEWFDNILTVVSVILWVIFFVVEILVLCAMVSMPQKEADYIIILGAQIRGKQITGSLRRRLDKGIRYLEENPKTVCIVSGGKGKGEDISEAEAMDEYLKTHGIEATRIRREDRSTTTCENLLFCRKFIKNLEKDKIGIISNNFHIYRAMKMARYIGYKKVFAIPATTDMVLFPNYMVREFFAFFIMFYELRKNA